MQTGRLYPQGARGIKCEYNGSVFEVRDNSGNVIYSLDPANRKMTFPSGSTLAMSGTQEFDDIIGGDASLAITGQAPASVTSAGGAIVGAGGIGGATSGAGGAVSWTGGVGTTNDVGGAASLVGGAGAGTGAGGALALTGGASGGGATGVGGAVVAAGGVASSTNDAGGLISCTGGAGAGTGDGGIASLVGGIGGATGDGGAVNITGGSSGGASDTGGAVNIDAGAANGGTIGAVNICSAATDTLGLYGATAVVQPADATQGALNSYTTGAFGLDSDANAQAQFDLIVQMRSALVGLGVMKGAA